MKLFNEAYIGNMPLKNRVIMPPMCMYEVHKHDGIATSFHLAHYVQRAIGQVGLIIVEATGVLPEGRITDRCLGLWNDTQKEALKPLVEAVHLQGSKIAIQLNHAGRKCTAIDGVDTIYAPSALAYDENSRIPQALTPEEIQIIIQAFRLSAKRADEAGFDAIEIHAAHGYLLSEFISPITNQRTDKYKDPSILLVELVAAIKTVWPHTKPIIIRISATDYEQSGYTVDDVAKILQPILNDIDAIHVSSGGITTTVPKAYPGYQVPFATQIKHLSNKPVIAVGLINEMSLALDIIENDRADFVAIGRALLRNPHWYLDALFKTDRHDKLPSAYVRGFR
jgi:NADPH2 dehydrogenase